VTRADRIAGCLYGAAIGDALGSAFEFVNAASIERHVGEAFVREYRPALRGSLLYPRAPGKPTDDTAMALSVAGTIASGEPLTAEAFARGFLADLERGTGRYAEMFWHGGPGGATTRALARLRTGADPATCGHPDDGGNGTAMRAHPVGFVRDRDEALRVAAVQARVTHGHPAAIAAAQAVAALVHDALAGREPGEDVPDGVDDAKFAAAWREMHRDLVRGERLPGHLRNVAMNAWATVSAAHAISLVYADDAAGAIAAAAASGGDTDTMACIVGGIVGARFGVVALPAEWVQGLVARAAIADAVERLAPFAGAGVWNGGVQIP
jgi:ADP-ribosylglycohydrolase